MARFELKMPGMGESVDEVTVVKWNKKIGDSLKAEDIIVEVASDKVDSEIPSPVSGVLVETCFSEKETVKIGQLLAVIEAEDVSSIQQEEEDAELKAEAANDKTSAFWKDINRQLIIHAGLEGKADIKLQDPLIAAHKTTEAEHANEEKETASNDNKLLFLTPLIRSIAQKENISQEELLQIKGSGIEGRLTKDDLFDYLKNRGKTVEEHKEPCASYNIEDSPVADTSVEPKAEPISTSSLEGEVIEMDRMRRLIAEHVVHTKNTAVHVTSFSEADVTNIVRWRERVKNSSNEKITFTPIFIEAAAKALRDFPMLNASVDGERIYLHKNINVGMAAATPDNNLIVPVISNADQRSLLELAKSVNELAYKVRTSNLKPDDVAGGTFTVTNVGAFGSLTGTPLIHQPQSAILAVGAIKKRPAVVETEYGDVIAIRQIVMLSLSYDHRIIDGALGGAFLQRIVHYLETFDTKRDL